jgi:pre-rRNA-processing protein TSR1
MNSKKQRLIFMPIDRNDVYSILDVGKVADLILVVMSCKNANESQIKENPWENSGAIDDRGYQALSLLRTQGMTSLIGILQHLEFSSSKRQPQIKKLFERYFVTEFTDQHKFMHVNELNLNNDINAILRKIAVTYPARLTWRNDRSYMYGQVTRLDLNKKEVVV